MADLSIKSKIREQVYLALKDLIADQVVRKIEWKNSLDMEEAQRPAIHLVFGHETPAELNEGFHAYYFDLPLFIRVMFEANTLAVEKADAIQAAIEAKLEADQQLGGWCVNITPEGTLPYISELQRPEAGFVMTYLILYHRLKANPYARC